MKIVLDMQSRQSHGSHHRGIGRYSLALAKAMARQAGNHEIHLVANAAFPQYLAEIKDDFQGLIPPEHIHVFTTPLQVAGNSPDNAWRVRAAEQVREQFLINLKADIIHVTSLFEGVGDNIVTSILNPELANHTAVTIYDLIPLVNADFYLRDVNVRRWYYRKLQSLKNAQLGLAISEYSRQEAISFLGLNPQSVYNLSGAVAASFRRVELSNEQQQALKQRFAINRPFIMHTGGAEKHKNVERLIEAYAYLNLDLRRQYQLVIAGKLQDWQHKHLSEQIRRYALTSHDVVLTNMLSDEEMIALYNMATLFVFPSLYEGFGLPVLEAMACGTPAIAANNSSLTEIVGFEDALFNGSDVQAIRQKIEQALMDQPFRQRLQEHAEQHVKNFSWDASAKRALTAFEAFQANKQTHSSKMVNGYAAAMPLPKLALVTTLGSPDSPLTQQTNRLIPALARYYDIEIIADQTNAASEWLMANFPILPRSWLKANPTRYQRRLYVIGLDHQDPDLITLVRELPGTLLLHELMLACLQESPEMLYLSHGYQALMTSDTSGYAGNKLLLDAAIGVITPNAALVTPVQQWYGEAATRYWTVIASDNQEQSICASWASGKAYYQAIEHFYAEHPLVYEGQLLAHLQTMVAPVPAAETDWLKVIKSMADNRPLFLSGLPVLFYDVSIFSRENHATGVHRVTRHILEELLKNPPKGYRIEPIYADHGHYRYARAMTHELLNLPALNLADDIVDFHAGDIFLHIDLGLHIAVEMEQELLYIRAKGVKVYYLVHDILPVRLPKDYFDAGVFKYFPLWLAVIHKVADGLICTTQTGLEDLKSWLEASAARHTNQPRLGYCSLGADIRKTADEEPLSAEQAQLLTTFKTKPTFLMVSTIEPRKGYQQALEAFELLWQQGVDVNLVIVGKRGWNIEELVTRIAQHPEQGKHLHWLNFVSEAMLAGLYENSSALLMASEGEGFGLPLIEAAQHSLPIIARGLPVFKEIAGEHAFYFDGLEPSALAQAIQQWLTLWRTNKAPQPEGIAWITWQESAEQIKEFLFGPVAKEV